MTRENMKVTKKTLGCFALALFVALSASMPQPASAAPTAPNWLPGQPLLAGAQVIAMWLPVPGAVKYVVYLDGAKLMETPANQYMGPAPTAGGIHKYEVAAVDGAGVEGPRSQPGQVTIIILEPPTDIMARETVKDDTKWIGVRWVPSQGGVISNVYRSESKEGPFSLLDSVQGTDNYKDSNVDFGKTYWYAITAKDITGKESGRSETVSVKLEESQAAAAAVAVKIDLVVVPTKETEALRFLGSVPVAEMEDIDRDAASGDLWVTLGEKGQVIVLTPTFERRLTISLKSFNEANNLQMKNATYVNVIEDLELALITDNFSSTILALNMDGQFVWAFKSVLPPEDREDIYEYLSDKNKTARLIPNQSVLLADGSLLISDGRAPLLYLVDAETGEIEDWFSGYERDGGKVQSAGIAALELVGPDLVWAGEPLLHRVVAFDPATMEVKYILGEDGKHDGFIAGFLGVNAFAKNPKDGSYLIADGGIGAVQAFNPETGEYMYHIGGSPPEPDPDLGGQRPLIDVGGISEVFFDAGGRLWLKHGLDKYFSIRQIDWDGKKVFKKEN